VCYFIPLSQQEPHGVRICNNLLCQELVPSAFRPFTCYVPSPLPSSLQVWGRTFELQIRPLPAVRFGCSLALLLSQLSDYHPEQERRLGEASKRKRFRAKRGVASAASGQSCREAATCLRAAGKGGQSAPLPQEAALCEL
jgi:hypothetical protein